jgi:hypothetical protein
LLNNTHKSSLIKGAICTDGLSGGQNYTFISQKIVTGGTCPPPQLRHWFKDTFSKARHVVNICLPVLGIDNATFI